MVIVFVCICILLTCYVGIDQIESFVTGNSRDEMLSSVFDKFDKFNVPVYDKSDFKTDINPSDTPELSEITRASGNSAVKFKYVQGTRFRFSIHLTSAHIQGTSIPVLGYVLYEFMSAANVIETATIMFGHGAFVPVVGEDAHIAYTILELPTCGILGVVIIRSLLPLMSI